jgi:autotransporter adhesin
MKKAILSLAISAVLPIFVIEAAHASMTFEQLNAMREVNEIAIEQFNTNRTPETTAAAAQTDAVYRQALEDYAQQTANPQQVPQLVPAAHTQSAPVTQLVPVAQQQTPQATPPRPQSVPVAQLVPVAQQQTPQATPPRPQSVPVAQLVPVAQQQTPLATPPRPQSAPVAQLVPVAQQQTPQATPPRPQSAPVAQRVPVAKKQATPRITGATYRAYVTAEQEQTAPISDTERNRQAIAEESAHVVANSQHIADTDHHLAALEQSTNSKFSDLNNEVNDNRKRASAGIAGVAAMANIPQVIQGQTLSVGAGAGTTDGESAVAVGFSARATDHVVVKASVSDDTQQNFVIGGGVSYGW